MLVFLLASSMCTFVIILFFKNTETTAQHLFQGFMIICNRSRLLDVTLYIYLCTWLLRFWRACWLHIDITVQDSKFHKTKVPSTSHLFTVRNKVCD